MHELFCGLYLWILLNNVVKKSAKNVRINDNFHLCRKERK